jgi:hypothetical protein
LRFGDRLRDDLLHIGDRQCIRVGGFTSATASAAAARATATPGKHHGEDDDPS